MVSSLYPIFVAEQFTHFHLRPGVPNPPAPASGCASTRTLVATPDRAGHR